MLLFIICSNNKCKICILNGLYFEVKYDVIYHEPYGLTKIIITTIIIINSINYFICILYV